MLFDIHSHTTSGFDQKHTSIYNCIVGRDRVPDKFFSAGIHPWYIHNIEKQYELLLSLVSSTNCLAIGECGIDKICNTPLLIQEKAFRLQCEIAKQLQKPIIIHAVKSHFDCMKIINEYQLKKVIFHGFNNRYTILEKISANNFYFSFGNALFNNRSHANALIPKISLSQLFFETDESNINIEMIYSKAAELCNKNYNELVKIVELNYNRVFL